MECLEEKIKRLRDLLPFGLKPYRHPRKENHYIIVHHVYNMEVLFNNYPDMEQLAKRIKRKYSKLE